MVACLIASACTGSETSIPPDSAPIASATWFVDDVKASGVDFVHQSGHRQRYLMPEIMGGGAALFDLDGDGDLDAYLVQSGSLLEPEASQPTNRLYRNRGDGRFDDITEGSGAGDSGYGMGVAGADYDADGDVDLYITNVGPNVLLRNDGDGQFTDVTKEAGVGDPGWGTSAVFFDYDGDGDLDLLVLNYLIWSISTEQDCYNQSGAKDYCSPQNYRAPALDILYRNDGNGTFAHVTADAGLVKPGTGLGVLVADFNSDGSQDVFVANDGMDDHLWLNRSDADGPRFDEEALFYGCAVDMTGEPKAGMGVTAADIDNDGDIDLMVCNLTGETDSFFVNNDGAFFTDSTALAGLAITSRLFTRFGMAWIDFDNDGYLDLFQANGGAVSRSQSFTSDPYAEPNLVFRGGPGERFVEILPRGGTAELLAATSRAAAFGDIDNDGGIDVLVVSRDGPVQVLRNVVPDRGHWIIFGVTYEDGRDAIGASVTHTLADRTVTRDVRPAYSYLASNSPRVHFGLGKATEVSDVVVLWPDGRRERFGRFPADRLVTLRRGDGDGLD